MDRYEPSDESGQESSSEAGENVDLKVLTLDEAPSTSILQDTAIDDLTPEKHQSLDQAVLKDDMLDLFASKQDSRFPAYLLTVVATHSGGKLDPIYKLKDNAKAILRDHPDLLDLVMKSWNQSSFRELRLLKILRPPSKSEPLDAVWSDPQKEANHLHGQFNRNFEGSASQQFLDAISVYDAIYNKNLHYGRTIPIVQSSGTGKSRMVKELGNLIPTVTICFRQDNLPTSGWPPNDAPAHSFLTKNRCTSGNPPTRLGSTDPRPEEVAAAFMAALFETVNTTLKSQEQSSSRLTVASVLRDWDIKDPANFTSSSRYKLFERVAQRAEELLVHHREELRSFRRGSPRSEPLTVPDWFDKVCKTVCKKSRQELGETLKRMSFERFVIAFDECTKLNCSAIDPIPGSKTLCTSPRMSLIALQRIIKACDQFNRQKYGTFWHVLLDTNLSVFEMAPSDERAPSFRLWGKLQPLPPWSFLGFDQMVVNTAVRKPQDALTLDHIMQYGRPYWRTLPPHSVVLAARHKLFLGEVFQPSALQHVFAALANRLVLDINQNEAGTRLATESVRSHLRILVGVYGQVIETFAPSEPVLAATAADVLNESLNNYIIAVKTFLNKLILDGPLIARGLRGELCSRFLLMLARDKATMKNHAEFFVREGTIPALLLFDFLEGLCGPGLGLPTDPLLPRLLGFADKCYINFTHFVQLSASVSELPEDVLYDAWCRHAAIQCAFNQPVIDGIIPFYKGDLSKPFDRKCLGYIIWQTKAQAVAAESRIVQEFSGPMIVAGTGEKRKRSKRTFLGLFVDLGTTSAFGKSGPRCKIIYDSATPAKGNDAWPGYADRVGETEPPRYCINVRGCRPDQYPVLDHFECSLEFQKVLQQSLMCAEPSLQIFVDKTRDSMDVLEVA